MLEVLLFLCQYELLSWILWIWIFMPQLRRITLKLCQLAFHIKNYLFYHLPTRGRARIKLGDAWYVSNVSIIFDCSILYYLLFWAILGFIIHFYIIFGTNLLTGGPTQICCFCLFQCSEEKEYQTESKRNEINWRSYFWKETHLMDLDPTSRKKQGAREGGGRAPCLMGPRGSPDVPPAPIYTYVT